ncbi:type II secretion system F family protein [Mumia quercus]|uniref:type II secretion system F family protein n=1 Tax=Mumia quercus TaxID=2976125 RepID=UPI0021CE5BEA|nr:type II secretion system F family protein [Mumia quercus]
MRAEGLEGVALALAALSAWLAVGPPQAARVVAPVTGPAGTPGGRAQTRTALTGSLAAMVIVTLAWSGVSLVAMLVAAGVVGVVVRLRGRARRRAQARRRHSEVAGACEALASELTTGTAASLAIERVAVEYAVLAPVASHARLGGDVVTALNAAATHPGAEGLRDLAAAWSVSTRSGASQVVVLDRVAESLRARDDLLREVDAALGSPRATARLLAVLPLLGLGLGVALGGDPLGFLLGGGLGSWCLAVGAGLAVAGVLWVERLTESAAR